jgi:hypothetical protein
VYILGANIADRLFTITTMPLLTYASITVLRSLNADIGIRPGA